MHLTDLSIRPSISILHISPLFNFQVTSEMRNRVKDLPDSTCINIYCLWSNFTITPLSCRPWPRSLIVWPVSPILPRKSLVIYRKIFTQWHFDKLHFLLLSLPKHMKLYDLEVIFLLFLYLQILAIERDFVFIAVLLWQVENLWEYLYNVKILILK